MPDPKFKVGDSVKVVNVSYASLGITNGKVRLIDVGHGSDYIYQISCLIYGHSTSKYWMLESDLDFDGPPPPVDDLDNWI